MIVQQNNEFYTTVMQTDVTIYYLNVESGSCCITAKRHHFLIQHADVQRDGQSFVQISFPQTSDGAYDVPSLYNNLHMRVRTSC